MTDNQAQTLVAQLVAGFPRGDWPEVHQRVFADRIRDLEFNAAQRAAMMMLESATFPPSIAEFRKASVQQMYGGKRPALDAWADVTRAIRRVGALYGEDDKAPAFSDPIAAYVVERLGWNHLCTSDTPDGVIEKRFCDFYEAIQDNEATVRQLSEACRPALRAMPQNIKQLISGIGTGDKEP